MSHLIDRAVNIMGSDSRSRKALANIVASMCLRGGSIAVSFVLIPLTIGLLDKYEYGVWVTLSALVLWAYVFDFGLGNGLRNRLAESLAAGRNVEAGEYTSTAYLIITATALVIFVAFMAASYVVDWYALLGVDKGKVNDLEGMLRIVTALFCVSFVGKLCVSVCQAIQLSSVSDLLLFASNLLSLIAVLVMRSLGEVSLYEAVMALSAAPAIVYVIATAVTFIRRPDLAPRFKMVRRNLIKPLATLSGRMFVADVGILMIFVTSNIVVSHMFGAAEVTVYTVAVKYFSLALAIYNVIISPMWSAATDAYARRDFVWLRATTRRLLYLWVLLTLVSAIMVAIAGPFYKLWVGDDVSVPFCLTVWCAVYASVSMLRDMLVYLVSGCGAVHIHAWSSALQALLFIPLSVILSSHMGVSGVPAAICAVYALTLLWAPVQLGKLFGGQARGIWAK